MIFVFSVHEISKDRSRDYRDSPPVSTALMTIALGTVIVEEGTDTPLAWVVRGMFPPGTEAPARQMMDAMNDWSTFLVGWKKLAEMK